MVGRNTEHAQMERVIAALVAYLDKHPTASDTLEGISRWWLPEAVSHSRTDVERALERLCAQGKIEKCSKADGQIHFRRRHAV
jgi:hypothetical protein